MLALASCFLMTAVAMPAAQQSPGLSLNPNSTPGPGSGCGSKSLGNANCNVIDFEGIGDNAPIGTIAGTPSVTFGPSWLGLIDADAGGNGNFANEPSPSTIAYFLTPADPIDFSTGVQSLQVYYTASSLSIPVTLTAYDGPSGTGNVVDTAIGNTDGTIDCTGDPNGGFCRWDVLNLTSSSNNILSIVLSGATANQFGFDDMSFCVTPPVTSYCTAKVNSLGCTPAIFGSGAPSATAATLFDVGATNVINNKFGVLVYGYASKNTPFEGGTLCVQNQIKRRPAFLSGGNPPPTNDCSGVYHLDFNAVIQGGSDPMLTAGTQVYCQYYYRDPADPFRLGLTDGLTFVINP